MYEIISLTIKKTLIMTYDDFTNDAQLLILHAQNCASKNNHKEVSLIHFISAYFDNKSNNHFLYKIINNPLVFRKIPRCIKLEIKEFVDLEKHEKQVVSSKMNIVLNDAKRVRNRFMLPKITTNMIFICLLSIKGNQIIDILLDNGVTPLKVFQKDYSVMTEI